MGEEDYRTDYSPVSMAGVSLISLIGNSLAAYGLYREGYIGGAAVFGTAAAGSGLLFADSLTRLGKTVLEPNEG